MMEFGGSGLFAPETGTAPMVFIAVALAAGWWLLPRLRPICIALLLSYAGLNLVGGAILSVLPLPFLPFAPDQSLSHYAVYGLYGLAQLPLICLATRALFFKQTATNG